MIGIAAEHCLQLIGAERKQTRQRGRGLADVGSLGSRYT